MIIQKNQWIKKNSFTSFIYQEFYALTNYVRSCILHDPMTIIRYKELHKNDTIFVLGSGPSLTSENLMLLNGKIVISYNASYKALTEVSPNYHYSCVSGSRVNLLAGMDRTIFDASFRCIGAYRGKINAGAIHEDDIVIRIPIKLFLFRVFDSKAGFSNELSKYILNGGAGSGLFYAIQIAAYMGASKIVLLGADFCADHQAGHFADFGQRQSAQYIAEVYSMRYPTRIKPALVRYKKEAHRRSFRLINASKRTADDVLLKDTLENLVSLS